MKSRLTVEQQEQICLDVEAGGKCSSVGYRFGISDTYVSHIYRKVRSVSIHYLREIQSIVVEYHAKIELLDDLIMIVIE